MQYEVYTHGSGRTSLQDNQSLQELLPWQHIHSWAKKPFLGTNSCSEWTLKKALAAPEEAVQTDAQMPHTHCSVSLRRRNLGLGGQAASGGGWLCPTCVAAVGHSELPSDSWVWQHDAKRAIESFTLHPVCSRGHYLPHRPRERGCSQWAFGMNAVQLQESQNQKVSLVSEAGTFPVWQLSLSPCRRRAMCKNIVILRITTFLTDLLTFCWRLHCFNDYMVGFWGFFVSLFSIRKKDVKKLLRSSQQNHREPGERGCHPHKNEAKCTRRRGASCVLPCLALGAAWLAVRLLSSCF